MNIHFQIFEMIIAKIRQGFKYYFIKIRTYSIILVNVVKQKGEHASVHPRVLYLVRSLITLPASISPAQPGTHALLAGWLRLPGGGASS